MVRKILQVMKRGKPPIDHHRCPFQLLRYFVILWVYLLAGCSPPLKNDRIVEIIFQSGSFQIVGDLRLPEGKGPFPVVVFVHGDGENDRTSGGSYLPIMARMLNAGYATFSWDKPGTGKSTGQIDGSRLIEQRSQIVLDAVATLKEQPDIDVQHIGMWGISQACFVMPRVLTKSDDFSFMIGISCAGVPGVDQGAYLVSSQAACAGVPDEDVNEMKLLLSKIERVQTYDEYVQLKKQLDSFPVSVAALNLGYKIGIMPEENWHKHSPDNDYFWNPIEVIEQTLIPVLVFYGTKDTQVDPFQGAQAYRDALERAGNPHFRVEMIPGTDHNIVLSKTGCLLERELRSKDEWLNYPVEYLDILEEWLLELKN